MRLDKIVCQNFFNHKRTTLDLTELGSPLLVLGENGGGKSSLINEALIFGIFGETRLNSVDDAIRNGSSEMGVQLNFNLNGQDIEIVRTKKRGKSAKLTLSVDGVSTEELLSETQKRIDKMFGLSINSFLSSIILKQEDADFFVKQKPDERKKIIGEILDLGQYERLEKLAKERRAMLKSEIRVEENMFNSIELKDDGILKTRLSALVKFAETFDADLTKFRDALNNALQANALVQQKNQARLQIINNNSKLEQMINLLQGKNKAMQSEIDKPVIFDASELNDDVNNLSSVITTYETQINELEEKYQYRFENELMANRNRLISVMSNLQAKLHQNRSEALVPYMENQAKLDLVKDRLRKMKNLSTGECATCFQSIDAKHHEKIIAETQVELDSLQAKFVELQTAIDTCEKAIKDWENSSTPELEALNKFIKKIEVSLEQEALTIRESKDNLAKKRIILQEKTTALQAVLQEKQRVNSLRSQIQENSTTIAGLSEQISEVPAEDTTKLIPVDGLKQSVSETEDKKTQANRAIHMLEAEIEQNESATAKKYELENALKDKTHKIELLEKLCVAFSRSGIPASIIETVLPEIEEISNHFLGKMSQGRLRIKFKTTQVQKNGVEKDTLDIEVYDGENWRSFESFSGGEQFRISLSIRLSLSKVLSRRANIDLQLLILDEAATSLDPTGREEFVQTILSLKNDFERIILMSHIPALMEEFDNKITLARTQDGTKLVSK